MYKKILVAYDGTKSCRGALKQGAELARAFGAELHLLGIVSTTGGLALAQAAGPSDVWGMKRKMIEEAMADTVRRLAQYDIHAITEVREGDPAAQIVASAHKLKPDIVVVGHSDRGALARWFQGSTSENLLHHLHGNLLIAR